MSEIPTIPPLTTFGPVEDRIPEIVARVAQNLHVTLPDDWVEQAVDSAVIFVIDRTNRNEIGLPADSLTVSGLVGFSTRIHQDAFSPNGAQVAVGDGSFEPTFLPENLWKHWRHYFTRLNPAWGVG